MVGLDLITSNGELFHISTTENAEMLDAARVSLGCLGVIYSVQLHCEQAFNLVQEERLTDLDEVIPTCFVEFALSVIR